MSLQLSVYVCLCCVANVESGHSFHIHKHTHKGSRHNAGTRTYHTTHRAAGVCVRMSVCVCLGIASPDAGLEGRGRGLLCVCIAAGDPLLEAGAFFGCMYVNVRVILSLAVVAPKIACVHVRV